MRDSALAIPVSLSRAAIRPFLFGLNEGSWVVLSFSPANVCIGGLADNTSVLVHGQY